MTTTKRQNGEGSVYQRKDGRWVAVVRDPNTGKKRSAYYPAEDAALKALRRMATRAEDRTVVLDAGATLRAYGADWLDNRAPRRRRESTVREYRRRLESYVWPHIGGVRLRELSPLDVEDLYDKLLSTGLSAGSVASVRNALSAILTDAVRARHLTTNVVRLARLPERSEKAAVTPPTVQQVGALLDAAAETPIGNLLVVLAGTGARIGEALGAQWADLDLKAGSWKVERTTTLSKDGKVLIGTRTKTGDTRTVVLSREVVTALRAQRRDVARARLAAGPLWVEHDLVFPSVVGTVQDSRNVRKVLRPIAEKAGFPGSFHALRHFVASVAVSSVPLTVVSKVLGHKRASTTTDLYAHLLESDAGSVAVAVSVAVKSGRKAKR